MRKENIYLSTIASDAPFFARKYGFGLEIAEYSTAWNMDRRFDVTDSRVRESLKGISRSIFHAPINELFPCAVDERPENWQHTVTGRQWIWQRAMDLKRW